MLKIQSHDVDFSWVQLYLGELDVVLVQAFDIPHARDRHPTILVVAI